MAYNKPAYAHPNDSSRRLRADGAKYLQRVRMLMTFIEQLRHTCTLVKRIAKTQLPAE